MCGIAGFQGDFDGALLARMACLIAHRGPDDEGFWSDPEAGVGLAHRRLSIIDLSPEGHQPMTNEDGSLWLTYNGEIYNFLELRTELEAKGHLFKSRTDSEVLLHLYEEEGPKMLRRLDGIFAFALWDSRQRQLLLCRDGMGVKPLYYAELPSGFLFASELKALLCEPRLPRDVDLAALHYHLAYLWAPAPHTMLRAVRKLEPGQAMLVREGRIERAWTWFDLPYNGQRDVRSFDALADELREQLGKAVRQQMVSDVPVGAFLSGGLDSSSVVALARQQGFDVPCYSIGFEGADLDGTPSDLPYARAVARHLGVRLQEIRVDPSMIGRLDEMLWLLDEPQGDPAPINALLIAERARGDGVKVLLSGAGGDDILSGYRRHAALNAERWWSWLPPAARGQLSRLASGTSGGSALQRRLAKVFRNAGGAPDRRLCGYFQWAPEETRRGLYTPALAADLALLDTDAPLLRSLARISSEPDRLNRMLYLEARHFLADHNLNYTDKASMAVGVEVRVPLLARELVDFAVRIPSGFKQRRLEGKAVFKRAMEPLLPRHVIYRQKTGFGVPLRRWLRKELQEQVRDRLSPGALARRGWFDPARVQQLLRDDAAGRIDGAYLIFQLLCLDIWCDRFLGSPSRLAEAA